MQGINSKQMSRLYKEARRKGFRHNSAFKAVGTAKVLSKKNINSRAPSLKRGKYRNLDFDGDRKVNKYDCKPLNKRKQDDYTPLGWKGNPYDKEEKAAWIRERQAIKDKALKSKKHKPTMWSKYRKLNSLQHW